MSLNLDFLGSGRPGDWIEAHVTLDKMGARLRFGTCQLKVGERVLLKASGVFAALAKRPRAA